MGVSESYPSLPLNVLQSNIMWYGDLLQLVQGRFQIWWTVDSWIPQNGGVYVHLHHLGLYQYSWLCEDGTSDPEGT